MSSTPESPSVPSHWEIPRDADPVPVELLEPPRYRCSEDGTRVYALADVAAHDEQFHAKTDGEAAQPSIPDPYLRQEALNLAIRRGSPSEDETRTTKRAEAFVAYLRGDPKPEAEPFVMRPAPTVLHRALDRTWDSVREDLSGLKALEGEDGDEDVLEVLRQLGDDDLRRTAFVMHVVDVLSAAVRAQRSEIR